ncbi:MAG: hypothetical protein WBA42_13010 [Mesorhizobium sp.]
MAVAFVAAYLLVLQSVVGAFALGLGPNPAQLDSFGNVICTHAGAAELPAGDTQPKHLPNCCVVGCTMASPALGVAPAAGGLQARLSFQTVVYRSTKPGHLALARDRSPANPRAPPVA